MVMSECKYCIDLTKVICMLSVYLIHSQYIPTLWITAHWFINAM